jgi:PKD domain
VFGAAALALAGIVLIVVRTSRRKPPQKDPPMHQLEIVTPRDATIAVAGRPVTFTARTEPPASAAQVRWTVATQPGEPGAHGIGPSFTYTFGATGVEQIVAHLDEDGLTCDVVLYVFKTPSGGSTVADLLLSEPPPVARTAESLRRWGTSASAPRRAS